MKKHPALLLVLLVLSVLLQLSCSKKQVKMAEIDAVEEEVADESAVAGGAEETYAYDGEAAPGVPLESKAMGKSRPGGVARGGGRASAPRSRPKSGGVKAGSSDDNKQFNYFLGFLEKFKREKTRKLDVSQRLIIEAVNEKGETLPDTRLTFKQKGKQVCFRKTHADGRALFFPSEKSDYGKKGLKLEAKFGNQVVEQKIDADGERLVQVVIPAARPDFKRPPADVAFLIDTTGSMGDEIARLKQTIKVIHFQLTESKEKPDLRFGMVLYRDKGDEYRTRVVPFTDSIDDFSEALNKVAAGGGGDYPEDVEAGLAEAMAKLQWRENGVKMLFLIADAPPHLDYKDIPSYVDSMRGAAAQGIKITSVGASGLSAQGEYIFRQMSQYTRGVFVFLTYGEKGESDGAMTADKGRVSHHTGENWQAESLELIIVRLVGRELAMLKGKSFVAEDYFEVFGDDAEADRLLDDMFKKGVQQLIDYATVRLAQGTAVGVLPVSTKDEELKAAAEMLEERLILNMFPDKTFKLVERKDLRQVLEEQKMALAGLFDDAGVVEVGKLMGAKTLLLSKLYRRGKKLEMYLKLVRVETGEIISVALLRIDGKLVKVEM